MNEDFYHNPQGKSNHSLRPKLGMGLAGKKAGEKVNTVLQIQSVHGSSASPHGTGDLF
jgi:hypothetical protein